MPPREPRKKHIWPWLGICAVILAGVLLSLHQVSLHIVKTSQDLTDIQYLGANTQRCIRLVLLDNGQRSMLQELNNQSYILLSPHSKSALHLLENPENQEQCLVTLALWETMIEIMEKTPLDKTELEHAMTSHYFAITDLGILANQEIALLQRQSLSLQLCAFLLFLLMISMIASHYHQTQTALLRNQELVKMASIDTETGLFNRRKCQDLLKQIRKQDENTMEAVIVFDINKLALTNDTLGVRMGDELIYNFARILKESSEIHQTRPFVGRYGGDEFVVYYRNLHNEEELQAFLKEVTFRTEGFHRQEPYLFLSYACGFAIDRNHQGKPRNLLELAEKHMISHKNEMMNQI